MLLFEMPVESLYKSSLSITEATLPRLVITMVSVHMIHETTKPSALFTAQLTNTELLVILSNLLFSHVAQLTLILQFVKRNDFARPSSFPFHRDGRHLIFHWCWNDLHVLVGVAVRTPVAGLLLPSTCWVCCRLLGTLNIDLYLDSDRWNIDFYVKII